MEENNTSCILTIIKNEQEYLDEFIKYHLNLGVGHIFIFEDMDSESHKDITDKYSADEVTLKNISSILDENKIKEAIDIKKTQKYSVQHLYLRNAVSYIKNQYQNKYEWCFLIDNDEFITLENENNNLNDILSLYNDYDALLLRWKCYGANGHIKKPNYDEGGLIETYTKEIENELDAPRYHNKTCYKLSAYENSFIKSSHHYPNNNCNYCNTEFVKDLEAPSYKNIYLRHYITKSWEEFVWKKTQRGFLFEKARNLNSFFILNKDMIDKKEELINGIK